MYTTTELADGDMVSCELTSSIECVVENPVMSNTVSTIVHEILPVSVSIETLTSEICDGEEVTFTATGENGGENPQYQWKLNGEDVGDNMPEFTSAELADGDVITCVLTSDANCISGNPAMSNTVDMIVNPFPGELNTPAGPDDIDIYSTPSSDYTTESDPNTTEYTWTVSPENAYTALSPDMNMISVTWAEDFSGQASIHVMGSNDCGDGPVSADFTVSVQNTFGIGENELNVGVSVFPNPNNGTFTLVLSSENNENVNLSIRSIIGEEVYSAEELNVSGELTEVIDLSKFAEGVYFLILENNNKVLTEKIVVQK